MLHMIGYLAWKLKQQAIGFALAEKGRHQMGKYNFEITEINPNTVHGMILSQIKPGSSVLECGCATGYMTKFMKEKLECKVNIIEIEPEAFNKAKQYAEDGYLGDLDDSKWHKFYKFYDYEFDYILFADVLEHLRDPFTTLKLAEDLLADGGKIIISIPNICHNDILVRMFYDHFNYSSLGLLDNTHIHFWGGNDLSSFIEQAGMKLTNVQALGIPTQHTEQRYSGDIDPTLLELLKKRPFGEVYQYVLTCEK